MEFITVYRPYRVADGFTGQSGYDIVPGGYLLHAGWPNGKLTALLPTDDTTLLVNEGMTARGTIKIKLERSGQDTQILEVRRGDLD